MITPWSEIVCPFSEANVPLSSGLKREPPSSASLTSLWSSEKRDDGEAEGGDDAGGDEGGDAAGGEEAGSDEDAE